VGHVIKKNNDLGTEHSEKFGGIILLFALTVSHIVQILIQCMSAFLPQDKNATTNVHTTLDKK